VPSWSASASDGSDLAALLRARQVRGYPECHANLRAAWDRQIAILEGAARGNLCAGVVRYELAQLYDLTGQHVQALLLHAANREQYPRFFRGRYRLAMSLEMLANPHSGIEECDMTALTEALRILDRCRRKSNLVLALGDGHQGNPLNGLGAPMLDAAREELQVVERYLTRRRMIWTSLRHRDERGVLKPYWPLRHRQAFHDGVRVALLLVAVRQAAGKLPHARTIAKITAAISGDSKDFGKWLPPKTAKRQQVTKQLRTRRWPRQCSTPSWPAAYNLACAYAALAANANAETERDLITKVIRSMEFAVCNPECEMERPSVWIGNDPDFSWLCRRKDDSFTTFLDAQDKRDFPADDQANVHAEAP
jgi:hypothetical protein